MRMTLQEGRDIRKIYSFRPSRKPDRVKYGQQFKYSPSENKRALMQCSASQFLEPDSPWWLYNSFLPVPGKFHQAPLKCILYSNIYNLRRWNKWCWLIALTLNSNILCTSPIIFHAARQRSLMKMWDIQRWEWWKVNRIKRNQSLKTEGGSEQIKNHVCVISLYF